jgi:hypothetical protein
MLRPALDGRSWPTGSRHVHLNRYYLPGPGRVRHDHPWAPRPLVGHDVERSAVGAGEHACEATTVELDRLYNFTAFAHPDSPLWGTSAYQIAPSASMQIPSGTPSPRWAHTRRPDRSSSAAMVRAVRTLPYDSARTRAELCGVITLPLGKAAQRLLIPVSYGPYLMGRIDGAEVIANSAATSGARGHRFDHLLKPSRVVL